MTASGEGERAAAAGRVLLWTGGALLALAALFNAPLVRALRAAGPLSPEALRETHRSQLLFAAAGALLALAGAAALRRKLRFLERRWAVRALFALLCAAGPLFLLERLLRPFVEQSTTIFARDDELGWRLVPGAEDDWLGVPVRVNAHGMRGPERPVEKPEGTRRVLFLGDSVTFGAFVAEDAATIPAQVERLLRERLGLPVECLNAGVGGYAPWQELLQLERLGSPHAPDLAVLGFVLNDVTEPLELRRFGGKSEGFQLEHTLAPGPLRWLRASAIGHFARQLGARRELGPDPQAGARRRELVGVYELLLNPNDERVRAAWARTLADLDAIVAACRARELPLLLVAHPYTLQLAQPQLDAPQRILGRFAAERGLPYVDLLPPLRAALAESGWGAEELYADAVHPNARGCAIIADVLAGRIAALDLLGDERE